MTPANRPAQETVGAHTPTTAESAAVLPPVPDEFLELWEAWAKGALLSTSIEAYRRETFEPRKQLFEYVAALLQRLAAADRLAEVAARVRDDHEIRSAAFVSSVSQYVLRDLRDTLAAYQAAGAPAGEGGGT